MRRYLATLPILTLIGCAPAAADLTTEPTTPPTESATRTPNPDAAALPLYCAADSVVNNTYGEPAEYYSTADEAFDAMTVQPSGDVERVVGQYHIFWVFFDDQDRKTAQVHAAQFSIRGWAVVSIKFCAGDLPLTPDVYTTLAPTPENAATAAAMPLNCAGEYSSGGVSDYIEGQGGASTPEEALAQYGDPLLSDTPTFIYQTETTVRWVFLNSEGRKVQELRGELSSWDTWIITSSSSCFPLD